MGQYHRICNLDKREYLDPHHLGSGLKVMEIMGTYPGPEQALTILLAGSCKNGPRGGGDIDGLTKTQMRFVGRWAGDRIVIIGDYETSGDYYKTTIDPRGTIWDDLDNWSDISAEMAEILETLFNGKFYDSIGYNTWRYNE